MTAKHRARLNIPSEIGSIGSTFAGTPQRRVFLIASAPNQPPAAEAKVYRLLHHLHGIVPLDRVFVTLDSSLRSGHMDGEFNTVPYRTFPDQEISREVLESMMESGRFAGALAFSATSQPNCPVETHDEWYSWAVSADALDQLSTADPKVSLAERLIAPSDASRDKTVQQDLFQVLRLEWDSERWLAERNSMGRFDTELEKLASDGKLDDEMVSVLRGYLDLAAQFYEGNITRTIAICDQISTWLGGRPSGDVAVVLGLPWIYAGREQLRRTRTGYVLLAPPDTHMRQMADDDVRHVIGELGQADLPLQDVFTGERMRDRVTSSKAWPGEQRRERSMRWIRAGQRLGAQRRLPDAVKCAVRAREIDPSNVYAVVFSGAAALDLGNLTEARDWCKRAIAMDARNDRAWALLGSAFARLGKKRRAARCLRRAIYLQPRDTYQWGELGHLYIDSDRRSFGCYCFRRGASLGCDHCRTNAQIRCQKDAGRNPLGLRPWVIWPMRLVLLRTVKVVRV